MREIRFRFFEDNGKFSKMWHDPMLMLIENKDDKDYTVWDVINGAFSNIKIMQFTGLKDKNGKECFEGDIVKMLDWGFRKKNKVLGIYKVIWDYEEKGWRLTPSPNIDAYNILRNFEVIGNIYENPELMKGVGDV